MFTTIVITQICNAYANYLLFSPSIIINNVFGSTRGISPNGLCSIYAHLMQIPGLDKFRVYDAERAFTCFGTSLNPTVYGHHHGMDMLCICSAPN